MSESMLLRHDQPSNLNAIQSHLNAMDWWERYPGDGVQVISWGVAMGPGQVVTQRLPPSLLPRVNVELERSTWGVFRSECYPNYDIAPVREIIRERARNGGQ